MPAIMKLFNKDNWKGTWWEEIWQSYRILLFLPILLLNSFKGSLINLKNLFAKKRVPQLM